VLEPLQSAFPPLLTARRHQRLDINRVVLDFYSHRNYRAAWTDGRDVAQLLKSLNDTQIDGLVPQDFRIAELEQARLALQATAPTPRNRRRSTWRQPVPTSRRYCSCDAVKSIRHGWTSTGTSTPSVSILART
jgi:hypothetical protein